MTKINSVFSERLQRYGTFDFTACYNCGNCTAVCSLTNEEESFPRNMVRYSIVGMEDEIKTSLKPWLCYYCGECTTHCPQEAEPGELMMTLRRWLTATYDWTRISGVLCRSVFWNIISFTLIAALVIYYAASRQFILEDMIHAGHLFEMIAIGAVFAIVLLPNVVRMWWFTILKPGHKVPLKAYFKSLGELFIHMFTQKRSLGCDDDQVRWFEHFILVIGYLALLFITVFLDWFSTERAWIIIMGYVMSGIIFVVTFHFMIERIRKKQEVSKHSRYTDWLFVAWLFLMGLTAYLVRMFIDLELLEQNVWLYIVHMIILAQWALIIVPFGKWTHFLYRSFAMYFERLLVSKKV